MADIPKNDLFYLNDRRRKATCTRCGSSLADPVQHRQWHQTLDRVLALQQPQPENYRGERTRGLKCGAMSSWLYDHKQEDPIIILHLDRSSKERKIRVTLKLKGKPDVVGVGVRAIHAFADALAKINIKVEET